MSSLETKSCAIKPKILIVDDEPDVGWMFSKLLPEEYQILQVRSGKEGLAAVQREKPDVIFLDIGLPDVSGVELLREIQGFDENLVVIVLTACAIVPTVVEAMKSGAYDYLVKPLPNERLKIIIQHALERRLLAQQVGSLQNKLEKRFTLEHMQGTSVPMQEVFDLVRRVATHDVNALILGESGTGKELVARAIHYESDRRNGPFVPVDCNALPETLIESELFGHERGAYTGAMTSAGGKFEAAQGGTIFLDEIGNLNKGVQAKLLRVVQEREIFRVGSTKPIRVHVRIIAATNRALDLAVRSGEFREDLYHRLNVFPIVLPPLRARQGDISILCNYFLAKFSREFHTGPKGISAGALEALNRYGWPGNVRELENAIKHALLMISNGQQSILLDHLPQAVREFPKARVIGDGSLREVSRIAQQTLEKEMILKTLAEVKGNKRKAARLLKIDYKTLFNKLKQYSLSGSDRL